MPSNHLILCCPLLLLLSVFPSIRVFSTSVCVLSCFIRVQLFATPWTAACQACLSFPVSWSLLKLMSIKSVVPSNHLVLCPSPSPPAFNLSQHQGLFKLVSSSHQVAKVLEFQLQHQSFQLIFKTDLRFTGWISLLSKGLSRVFSNTTVQKHQFFGAQLSSQSNFSHDFWKNHSLD